MRVFLLTAVLFVCVSYSSAQEPPPAEKRLPPPAASMRRSHIEIVNGEPTTIAFQVRCGGDAFTEQKLESGKNAEYRCEEAFVVSIKTNIKGEKPTIVLRSLDSETRNELFWDEKKRRYDIRRVE
jgi:hypothetical protein